MDEEEDERFYDDPEGLFLEMLESVNEPELAEALRTVFKYKGGEEENEDLNSVSWPIQQSDSGLNFGFTIGISRWYP